MSLCHFYVNNFFHIDLSISHFQISQCVYHCVIFMYVSVSLRRGQVTFLHARVSLGNSHVCQCIWVGMCRLYVTVIYVGVCLYHFSVTFM